LDELGSDRLTLLHQLETAVCAPEDTAGVDDCDARQEETLVALFVYGGSARLISQMRRSTVRAVCSQRQLALESLMALRMDNVEGVLTGRYATIEDAKASIIRAPENVIT